MTRLTTLLTSLSLLALALLALVPGGSVSAACASVQPIGIGVVSVADYTVSIDGTPGGEVCVSSGSAEASAHTCDIEVRNEDDRIAGSEPKDTQATVVFPDQS